MELFKYCRREYWYALNARGCVRVGSLHDYQRTDKYGELTADALEGSKRLAGTIYGVTEQNIASYPGLEGLIHIEGDGNIGIEEVVVSNYVRSVPNLLVFSASASYSSVTHKRWYYEERYDTCYKILSARLFFRALTEVLGRQYVFLGFGRVHYADEIDIATPEAGIHPALVKRRTGYSDQAEIRALWQMREGQNPSPVILPESRVRLYAQLRAILPASEG